MLAVMLLAMVQAAPETVSVSAPKDSERKICRRIEQSGTRMGSGRVCKTADQWKLDKDEAEGVLAAKQNRDLEVPVLNVPAAPQ